MNKLQLKQNFIPDEKNPIINFICQKIINILDKSYKTGLIYLLNFTEKQNISITTYYDAIMIIYNAKKYYFLLHFLLFFNTILSIYFINTVISVICIINTLVLILLILTLYLYKSSQIDKLFEKFENDIKQIDNIYSTKEFES